MKHKPRISEYGALLATLGHLTHPCCQPVFPNYAFLFKSKANIGGTIKLLNLIQFQNPAIDNNHPTVPRNVIYT